MGTQLYNIGITGLNAANAGLITTGHNISNAATPGYSRQQVVYGVNTPQLTGSGFLGQGVRVETVQRVYSQFLSAQVLEAQTQSAEYQAYATELSGLDNMLADTTAGLSPALTQFFSAVQSLSSAPASLASRQSVISAAEALSARFNTLDQRMQQMRQGLNTQIAGSVSEINTLAAKVADLNERIVTLQASTGELRQANDLLDERDRLIGEINKQVRVTQLPQDNGTINLFVGSGQPIVVGGKSFDLNVVPSQDDPARMEVGYTAPDGTQLRMRQDSLTGGTLGGLLSYRTEVLDVAQNSLGRVAIALATDVNSQHALGQDLNGNMGVQFFSFDTPEAIAATTNDAAVGATVTVTLTDVSELTASDYRLSFDGTNYTLRRLSDDTVWTDTTLTGLPPSGAGQGFTLSESAILPATGMAAGDSFLIRPTRTGAGTLDTVVSDPRLLAVAGPMRSVATATNTGTGKISAGEVSSTTGLPLAASPAGDITLSFDAATNTFTVTGGSGGSLAYDPSTESAGKTFTFANEGGYTFTLSGVPQDGDSFVIQRNAAGSGDNRNIVSLAALQNSTPIDGGLTGYMGSYAQLVSDVGAKGREVQVNLSAQEILVERVEESMQSISGVNLDEEAANLLRYQQAYQASAKMIELASKLFDTLLTMGA